MEAYSGGCNNLQALACSSIKEYWPVYDRHALVELTKRTPGEVIYIRVFGAGTVEEGEFGLCAYGGNPLTSCRINFIEALSQTTCNGSTSTYDQTIKVTYRNSGANEFIYINNKAYAVTGSPQTIVLKDLVADGKVVNVTANIGNSADDLCWQQSFYKTYGLFTAPQSCLTISLANDDCVGAIEITPGTSCSRKIYSNLGATFSAGSSSYSSCGVSGYKPNDVWFKVKVPSNGNVTFSAPLLFNENNMIIEAYAGKCDAMVRIDCDQFGGSQGSEIKLTGRTSGEMIYYRVADQGNNTQGDFAICAYSPAPSGFNTEATNTEDEPQIAWRYDEETQSIIIVEEGEEVEEANFVEEAIVEAITEVEVIAYPNPTTDVLNIEFSNALIDAEISLFDLRGKLLKNIVPASSDYDQRKIRLNVSDLNVGQYYLNISSAQYRTTKLVQIVR